MGKKQLTRKEMEEMLPDYIFRRLSKEDCEAFEGSLPNFPDLAVEIEEVRKIFSKLENMDIDGYLERKTRNIPVKVANRFTKRKSPLEIFSLKGFVTAVAGFGVIIIALSIFLSKSFRNEIRLNESTNGFVRDVRIEKTPLISPEIPDSLVEFSSSFYGFDFPVGDGYINILDEKITEDLTELVNEDLVKLVDSKHLIHFSFEKQSELELIQNLERINEKEFQQIIKELKNVEI